MSILFSEIYTKAIALFDDPQITRAYETNEVQFQKIMYSNFQNAIAMFNNPLIIASRLTSYNPPQGIMEKFEGDGENNTFTLDDDFEIIPNSVYAYTEGDLFIRDHSKVKLDIENRTITFPDILPQGQEYSIEQYFPGEFTGDFSKLNMNTNKIDPVVSNMTKDVLARLLVRAWGESKRNMLLDIINLMQDSDFKISDNSKILKSKNEWIDQMDFETTQLTNKLAWQVRFAGGSLISPGIGRG